MARTFNGTSDKITFGSDTAADDLPAFTAFALFKTTANITDERQLLTKMTSGFVGKMYLSFYGDVNGNNQVNIIISRATVTAQARSVADVFSPNVWTVVISTWDGSTAPKIYISTLGNAPTEVSGYIDSVAGSGSPVSDATATLTVGSRDSADATFYAGGAADFGLWNRVLDSNEIWFLGFGNSPEFIQNGLISSCRVTGLVSPEINYQGTTNGTVTGTSFLAHPTVAYPGKVYLRRPVRPRGFAPGLAR